MLYAPCVHVRGRPCADTEQLLHAILPVCSCLQFVTVSADARTLPCLTCLKGFVVKTDAAGKATLRCSIGTNCPGSKTFNFKVDQLVDVLRITVSNVSRSSSYGSPNGPLVCFGHRLHKGSNKHAQHCRCFDVAAGTFCRTIGMLRTKQYAIPCHITLQVPLVQHAWLTSLKLAVLLLICLLHTQQECEEQQARHRRSTRRLAQHLEAELLPAAAPATSIPPASYALTSLASLVSPANVNCPTELPQKLSIQPPAAEAPQSSTLRQAFVITVLDQNNAPVRGKLVRFNTITPATTALRCEERATDASGRATLACSAVAGVDVPPGQYQLTAQVRNCRVDMGGFSTENFCLRSVGRATLTIKVRKFGVRANWCASSITTCMPQCCVIWKQPHTGIVQVLPACLLLAATAA
jgi:hypothetical protein